MVASVKGYIDIVRLLLDHGANPDIQDLWMETALKMAYVKGHEDIVAMLKY